MASDGASRREIHAAAMREAAARSVGVFAARTEHVPYEDKGVLRSEMLFLYAVLRAAPRPPQRILESGRARGQSTLLLSLCFPDRPIVSIELDDSSDDARHGERRLRSRTNVECRTGDAKELLPALVRPGDAVLIDGPKSYRALHLALELLATRRPSFVFLHDFYQGQPERELLERLVPEAFFSDEPAFVSEYRHLDEPGWQTIRERNLGLWRPYLYAGVEQRSYGPTLACLPFDPDRAYEKDAEAVLRAGFEERAGTLRRTRSRAAPHRSGA